ncbi:MAG: transposase, partial [Fidelibacterota bacterium]
VTYDRYLDTTTSGPQFLKDKRVAKMICTAMLHLDNLKYELLAFCVMSNHVHLVFTPLRMDTGEYHSLAEIMHSIKSYTASEVNRILGRKGTPFWQHESFDHFCRDEKDVERVIEYTVNNPVRAGLVDKAEDWPWSYVSS